MFSPAEKLLRTVRSEQPKVLTRKLQFSYCSFIPVSDHTMVVIPNLL